MSIEPLDRKIGLILKDGVPRLVFFVCFGFFVRRDLNGFSPITPLQIWFDPFSMEAGFLCTGLEDRRQAVLVKSSEEGERQKHGRRDVYVRQHLSEMV